MNVWQRFKTWLHQKTAPAALTGAQWTGTSFQDAFKRFRNPTANELMAELKNTAWTCASLNSSVCATYTPALYVITQHHQPRPKCATKALHPSKEAKLRANPQLRARLKMAEKIEEVTDHPLIDLLASPNPHHSAFDLWELTTLYQEVHGSAYWFLDMDAIFGVPQAIWLLPAQNVTWTPSSAKKPVARSMPCPGLVCLANDEPPFTEGRSGLSAANLAFSVAVAHDGRGDCRH